MLGVERVREEKAEGELVDEINSGPAIVKFRVIESRSGPRKDTLLEWDWSKGSVHEIDVTAAPPADDSLLDGACCTHKTDDE